MMMIDHDTTLVQRALELVTPQTTTTGRAHAIATRWLVGLALLAPSACGSEDELAAGELDEALEDEDAEAPAVIVVSPMDTQDHERLGRYGKTEFVAPARVPAAELAVGEAELDPVAHARLTEGLSGHEALFVRRRVDDGRSQEVETEARSSLLEAASIDPMRAHVQALGEQTGLDLGISLTVEKGETGEVEITEALVYRGQTPDPKAPDDRYTTQVDPARRLAAVERELDTLDPELGEDGRLVVYATFIPRVPADAPLRVDWLAEHESREQAMAQAELERQAELEGLMATTTRKLQALGACELHGRSRAAHAGYLRCTPDELRTLARDAEFVLELDVLDQGQPMGMRGDDKRGATGSQSQLALSGSFDGDHGTAGSGRVDVEVALLDGEGFYRAWEHPAFDDWADGPSRIDRHLYCNSSGNCYNDTVSGTVSNHGARAMIGAFSHLLQGQDPTVPNAADREDRTHGAYEARLETYRWLEDDGEPALTLEYASDPTVGNGVDIAVISWGNSACNNVDAHTAWRDAWDFAYSHGTFGVISAGNSVKETNDDCTANGWATRVDMLAVGAFGDNVGDMTNGKAATPISSWSYDTQPLMGWHWTDLAGATNCINADDDDDTDCWSSAYGGGKLRFGDGVVRSARDVIDVVAPAGRELGAKMTGPAAASYGNQCCGTSMAAPEAASAAVTLKDWANSSGYGVFTDPGFMHVNMLLMGDGTRGDHDAGAAPAGSTSNMDPLWGAGRLKMRLFSDAGMDGPWAWGTGAFWIYDGDVVDVVIGGAPIGNDVDAFTSAFAWDEPYLNSSDATHAAADIVFRVVVTNPVNGVCVNPGGSGGTTVYSDLSYDPQKVIRIRPGVIEQLHGKCAWMRYQAYDIPTGPDGFARRYVYRADYWEDLDREVAEGLANIE